MLTPAALDFIAQLVGAGDPAALYAAFETGLAPLFDCHSLVASFDFERDGSGAGSSWRWGPLPALPADAWARVNALLPALPYLKARPGLTVCVSDVVVPDALLEVHPFYREFMEPYGWRYSLALLVWERKALVGAVALNRTPVRGPFDAADQALAAALQPFVAAAWRRLADHGRERDARRAQEHLLQTLPVPAFVFSLRTERVLFHNVAALTAIAKWRGELAKKRPRTLTARGLPPANLAALRAMPDDERATHAIDGPQSLRARLRRMESREHFKSDVVLVVIDDAVPRSSSAAWLRLARTLSPSELAVARETVRGLSNDAIASALGKSPNTVRKQLEAVFAKAGVRSRTELTARFGGAASRVRG